MYDLMLTKFEKQKKPIDIIVAGLGFMGFGFLASIAKTPGIRVPLVLSRRPEEARNFLAAQGFDAVIENRTSQIHKLANTNKICVTDDLDVIARFENEIVFEVTGTVNYGTQIALKTLDANKNLITMNPELQVSVGTQLKKIADQNGVTITDVMGDQPGNLANLITKSRLQGFKILIAGNMKRFLDIRATQAKMQSWANDKGLAVRQTTSFTDGTKQAIEMELVGNYFGMTVLQKGMQGPEAKDVRETLEAFDWSNIPVQGCVDYALGLSLFPGVFAIVEPQDSHQAKYLRYLNLGDGPRYVLFDPYHLCHLEVIKTMGKVLFYGKGTIDNGLKPVLRTYATAKFDLVAGQVLDGIGGDTVYGTIDTLATGKNFLPVGFALDARLKRNIAQDQPIALDDVELPQNPATKLAELV